MLYLFVALVFFLDAVVIHLLVCRQAKEEGLLLRIFFVIAGFNLMVCWVAFYFMLKRWSGVSGVLFTPMILSSTILYLACIPTYLIFYFSTQQVSPSKKIMLLLSERPMSLPELSDHFRDEDLVAPRINELIATQCLNFKDGCYSLSMAGQALARSYAFYQVILGRKKGG